MKIFQGVAVERVLSDGVKVTGVDTDHGQIKCDKFVNCAGQVSELFLLCSWTPPPFVVLCLLLIRLLCGLPHCGKQNILIYMLKAR